ncbi:MAG: hypothetical protein Q9M31_07140 [Mariprofundus sp.]|nr:hypothetical protein [Mariprofundus sp.]
MDSNDGVDQIHTELISSHNPELIDILAHASTTRIERIVSHGQSSPDDFWYDQCEDEWVILLTGAAVIAFEKENSETLEPIAKLWVDERQSHFESIFEVE